MNQNNVKYSSSQIICLNMIRYGYVLHAYFQVAVDSSSIMVHWLVEYPNTWSGLGIYLILWGIPCFLVTNNACKGGFCLPHISCYSAICNLINTLSSACALGRLGSLYFMAYGLRLLSTYVYLYFKPIYIRISSMARSRIPCGWRVHR